MFLTRLSIDTDVVHGELCVSWCSKHLWHIAISWLAFSSESCLLRPSRATRAYVRLRELCRSFVRPLDGSSLPAHLLFLESLVSARLCSIAFERDSRCHPRETSKFGALALVRCRARPVSIERRPS